MIEDKLEFEPKNKKEIEKLDDKHYIWHERKKKINNYDKNDIRYENKGKKYRRN